MAINACRDSYLEKIVKSVYEGEDLYLVAADLAAPCLDKFREDYPQRYVPVGIAEQNLIAVASGLALSGKKVIAYTGNPFLISRAFDQIRNCVCHMNLCIALVGLGAGFATPDYGFTHFILDDVSMLRGLPKLKIFNISDTNLAKYTAKMTLNLPHPIYVRIDRLVDKEYELTDKDVSRGFRFLHKGTGKICVISTGMMSSECLEVVSGRPEFAEKVTLIDLFSFPFDEKLLIDELKNYSQIITVEELRLQGGMGSAVLEALNDAGIYIPVKRMGVDISENVSPHYGSHDWHLKQFGLDKNSISENIMSALK